MTPQLSYGWKKIIPSEFIWIKNTKVKRLLYDLYCVYYMYQNNNNYIMSIGQGIGECVFDIAYMTTALTLGTIMCLKSPARYYTMFGAMAILLACGDAFHLFPRFIGLLSNNM